MGKIKRKSYPSRFLSASFDIRRLIGDHSGCGGIATTGAPVQAPWRGGGGLAGYPAGGGAPYQIALGISRGRR